jgi:cation transporter-like permease
MKANKSYYFFQVLGHLLFFSFISASGISAIEGKIDFTYETMSFLKNITFSLLATHFILRAYIKKHLQENQSLIKIFSVAIFYAAIITTLANLIWGIVFGNPEKVYSISNILIKAVISFLLYSMWSVLYIAITSIRERIKLRQQLRDQELASLMNQINPHFLFNSLNTIRGMIFEDKDKSAELVTKLSTLFRYNLSTDTKAHTSLGAELEVCQHYLAIEDIRLGERLKVSINISPESKSAKIPTMGILTLIENAIKHGIAHLQKGGMITLNSKVVNNTLLVEVINPFQRELVKSGTQVGLKNIEQRIELIFGSQGKINQTSTDGIFTVTLALPFEAI